MAKLKKCPFCGGTAHIMKMGFPHWVYCEECGAKVQGRTFEEKDSVAAWNKRADEITEEQVAEYLDARNLTIITIEQFEYLLNTYAGGDDGGKL